jgi:hypothetical protein
MSVNDGQPFSAKYRSVVRGAGGLNLGKADTEMRDNAMEAGGTYSNTKIAFIDNVYYLVYWDNGRGLETLTHLFGLGDTMPTKTDDDTAGMFNHGHTAATAFWDPDFVYSESMCNGHFDSLNFESAKYLEAINKNLDDLRRTHIANYMKSIPERLPTKTKFIQQILEQIRTPELKQQLQSICDQTAPHYMLHIFKLRPDYRFSESEFVAFFDNLRLYYYKVLRTGKSMALEVSEPLEDHEDQIFFEANANNSIDPLYNKDTFSVFHSRFDIREITDTKKRMGQLVLSLPDGTSVAPIYYVYSQDKRRKFPVAQDAEPAEWSNAISLLVLTGTTNHISAETATEQVNMFTGAGSDFNGIDDLRGVWIEFGQRILGKPHWRSGGIVQRGFGDKRNSGHARCLVKPSGSKQVIAKLLNIQSNKHGTNLTDCDLLIHEYLFAAFGTVTQHYSCYTIANSTAGRTYVWNLEEFRKYIVEKPKVVPAPPKPVPPPSNPFDNSSSSSSSAESSESEDSDATPPPIPPPIPPVLPIVPPVQPVEPEQTDDEYTFVYNNSYLVVSQNDRELERILCPGDESGLKSMLLNNLAILGTNEFPTYLSALANLHRLTFRLV